MNQSQARVLVSDQSVCCSRTSTRYMPVDQCQSAVWFKQTVQSVTVCRPEVIICCRYVSVFGVPESWCLLVAAGGLRVEGVPPQPSPPGSSSRWGGRKDGRDGPALSATHTTHGPYTHTQTDTQTDRQTDRQTDGQTDRQRERKRVCWLSSNWQLMWLCCECVLVRSSFLPVLHDDTEQHLQTKCSILFIIRLFIRGDWDQSLKRKNGFVLVIFITGPWCKCHLTKNILQAPWANPTYVSR